MTGTCDLCGRTTDDLYEVEINGHRFVVCSECKDLGKVIKKLGQSPSKPKIKIERPKERISEEDLWEDEELEENEQLIKKLRTYMSKNGLSVDELARKIQVKDSILRRVLNNDLIAPDDVVQKIKKFLKKENYL